MERVCQSVQYKVSSDSVSAKGWVRVPSTTVSLQDKIKASLEGEDGLCFVLENPVAKCYCYLSHMELNLKKYFKNVGNYKLCIFM